LPGEPASKFNLKLAVLPADDTHINKERMHGRDWLAQPDL
jgi:hypothetical protein